MSARKSFVKGQQVTVMYRGLTCQATYKQVQRDGNQKYHLVYIPTLNKEELVDDVNIRKH